MVLWPQERKTCYDFSERQVSSERIVVKLKLSSSQVTASVMLVTAWIPHLKRKILSLCYAYLDSAINFGLPEAPKIMASSPITSWQIDGETVETVADFIFLGSKITADGDCRHEIKRHLLLGRKVMTNLDSALKSRDITLPTEVLLVKAMVFPVVMYGCESWSIKKAEHWRIDAFELWCWRRLLRVSWTARRSNQSILKEISPGCSLERLMLKLGTPILWPPDAKSWLTGKDPDAGKDWRQEEKETTEDEMVGWHYQLNGHEFGWTPGVGDWQGGLACCGPQGHKESDMTEWLNWTELRMLLIMTLDFCLSDANGSNGVPFVRIFNIIVRIGTNLSMKLYF